MTLDGFCDHTSGVPDEEIHHHYADLLRSAEVALYGRITPDGESVPALTSRKTGTGLVLNESKKENLNLSAYLLPDSFNFIKLSTSTSINLLLWLIILSAKATIFFMFFGLAASISSSILCKSKGSSLT